MNGLLELLCFTFVILFFKSVFWGRRIRHEIECNEYHKDKDRYISEIMLKFNYLYLRSKKYISNLNFYGNLLTFIWAVVYFFSGIVYLYIYKSVFGEIIYYTNIAFIVILCLVGLCYSVLSKPRKDSRFYKRDLIRRIIILVCLAIAAVLLIEKIIMS